LVPIDCCSGCAQHNRIIIEYVAPGSSGANVTFPKNPKFAHSQQPFTTRSQG
jgi:hypothetical protein